MSMGPAALLSGAIVLAALLLGGRYTVSGPVTFGTINRPVIYRVDRFTGAVYVCQAAECFAAEMDPPAPAR